MKRDKNGRFAKGNKGGPGRPRRSVEERYLEAIKKAVTTEDLRQIFVTGFARAKAGDLGWGKLICEYLIGKPTQYIDQNLSVDSESGYTIRFVWEDSGNDDQAPETSQREAEDIDFL